MTGGQTHDSVSAIDLLKQIDVSESNILGDKAYGAQTIREWITAQGGNYTIPPKKKVHQTPGVSIGTCIKNVI